MNGLWQSQRRSASAVRAVRILILVSILSGCSWFGGGSKPQANDQSASFPNLGTVPAKAPATSSGQQREQLTQGLVADQQNASYSADALTAAASSGSVPPPEPPPPAPSAGESTSAEASPA